MKTKEAIFIPNEITHFTRDRGRERVRDFFGNFHLILLITIVSSSGSDLPGPSTAAFVIAVLLALNIVGAVSGRIGLPPAIMGWAASCGDGP